LGIEDIWVRSKWEGQKEGVDVLPFFTMDVLNSRNAYIVVEAPKCASEVGFIVEQ